MPKVLILCTGNSCRSQMAEAFFAKEGWAAFSAGSKPTGNVHPLAIQAMQELDIDLSSYESKSLDRYLDEDFDLVVTVCDNARESCPVFPNARRTLHWPFDDPAESKNIAEFRRVRDQIAQRIQNFLKTEPPIVLFLCTGNSARSQMAEALLAKYGEGRYVACSAGLDPKGINPLTVQVLNEIGIDISHHRSKRVGEFLGKVPVRYAIMVCDNAERHCPRLWPFGATVLSWPFEDPAACEGTLSEKLEKFRDVRNQIQTRILEWLKEQK